MSDLDQVCFIEQGHLQKAVFGKVLDLVGPQGRDPFDAPGGEKILADAGASDHAPIADQHDLCESEALDGA